MDISRKDFIRLLVVFGAGGVAAACGGGDKSPSCTKNGATGISISNNHGHSLMIPAEDFSANAAKTYSIQGQSGHNHEITLTAEQMGQLAKGQAVMATSTNVANHTHDVTVTCA